MHKLFIIILLLVIVPAWAGEARAQAEQESGTELKFENVDEIRNRPSDIHIGSDPEYRPGMEQEVGGTDETGYQKEGVETDQEYIQEKTYYKRVDEKKHKPQPRRWDD
jgi:hypothetical protein